MITKNAWHAIGCYMTTATMKALTPLCILDGNTKIPENYQIDPRVCIGLPKVKGMYGLDKSTSFSSFVAVWSKGSMDTSI